MLCLNFPKVYRLNGATYEVIKEQVVDLFEDFGISSIPVYPGRILQVMGYEVVSYDIFNEEEKEIVCKYSRDAFRYNLNSGKTKRVLYSPDKQKERIRFSLAHELGHIVLGHDFKEDPYQEAEANFFAGYLLAPVPIVPYVCNIQNTDSISREFVVSSECAENIYRRCVTRKKCGADVKEYESRLLNLFGYSTDLFQKWIKSS